MHLEIQRVIYFTNNIETMARFYGKIIGLELVTSNDEQWKEFTAGGCNIALHPGKPNPGTRGPRIVFYTADVANSRAILIKRGAPDMGKVVSGDGLSFCDGKDPDGNPFQISTRHR